MRVRKERFAKPKGKIVEKRHDPGFYARTAWRNRRMAVLLNEPLCRVCFQAALLTPAVCVDHIVPRAVGGEDYDLNNLQPLCLSCHSAKTSKENH